MHLGNVRTALFNVLLARANHGQFLLRIEDTDATRSQAAFTELLQQDLKWLSLDWTEGPYFQSQRQAIYQQYYVQLETQGDVYPCFCSDEQLALSRKIQISSGQPPRYAGTCLKLSQEQIAEKIAQGSKPTLRFKIPRGQIIEFNDLVKGPQRFVSDDIGDFIIRRADGTASFFFCNAIDDAVMGVTHAIRGEDHLTNTPRQLLLLKALNLRTPIYGHMALILGSDGSPLSKRNGSRSLEELRTQGYLPITINNYLGRLGHYYVSNELMNLDNLAKAFSTENLSNAPAHFDEVQLLHWQKLAVAQLSKKDFWQWVTQHEPTLAKIVPNQLQEAFMDTVHPNTVFPKDALFWAQIFFGDETFSPEALSILRATDKQFFLVLDKAIQQSGLDYSVITKTLQSELNLKGKALFQPLRLILTGQMHGPELVNVLRLLSPEKIRAHIEKI